MLGLIVFGLVVGLIARLLMPGKDNLGLIATCLLGIAGAFLGGWLGQVMGLYTVGEPAGFVMATIGAVLVLFLFNMVTKRRRLHHP